MRNLLARKPDTVVLLLATYFVVAFVVRLLVPNGLRVDESQQAFFSQWLVAGYDTQPPLYNWFQAMVVSVVGLSIATIAAAKNLVLFLLFLSYYKLAKLVLDDRLFAAIATLSLFTIPQVFWQAQRDLTHTVSPDADDQPVYLQHHQDAEGAFAVLLRDDRRDARPRHAVRSTILPSSCLGHLLRCSCIRRA